MNKSNIVYVIQMGDTQYFKIGITNDVNKRLKSLQTGNPLPLHIITTIEIDWQDQNVIFVGSNSITRVIERHFHKTFDYCKEIGEWFNFEHNEEKNIEQWAKNKIINHLQDYGELCKMCEQTREQALKEIFK